MFLPYVWFSLLLDMASDPFISGHSDFRVRELKKPKQQGRYALKAHLRFQCLNSNREQEDRFGRYDEFTGIHGYCSYCMGDGSRITLKL